MAPKNADVNFISNLQTKIFIPNVIPTYKFSTVSVGLINVQPFALYKIPVSVVSPDLKFKTQQALEVNLLPFETKDIEIGIQPKRFLA